MASPAVEERHPGRRAVRCVAARAAGNGPVDPGLRVTAHDHPDRDSGDATVLEALRRDGRYRSRFATGTGNGGLTAVPGGDRWRWESRLFGGAYDDAAPSDRPVHGSLDHRRRPAGGSVRSGSAHLRLTAAVLTRTTPCHPDSAFEPTDVGTPAHGSHLVRLTEAAAADALDDHVEAHVHRPVDLPRDVAALVLDPCHRGTEVEDRARTLGCPVGWHHGFRLGAEVLARHPGHRGGAVVDCGLALAADTGQLDARVIGDAARLGRHDDQLLERLRHCVARFGGPVER